MIGSDPISDVRRALEYHGAIRLALVFGSLAKENARFDSDLDLAIRADRPLNASDKASLIAELADVTGRPVDLIDLRTVGEPLLGEILAHGKRIIGNEQEFAQLLLRHLYDEADFLPYRDRILEERRKAWIGG